MSDGPVLRDLASTAKQSLAEATLGIGGRTKRHYHRVIEEVYLFVDGDGVMELDGERRPVSAGDTVVIPPNAWHQFTAGAGGARFLCTCVPPFNPDDTFFG